MKIEARRNGLRLTLETQDLLTHAAMTDHKAAVEVALQKAASWFQAEIEMIVNRKLARRPGPDRVEFFPGAIVYVEGQGDPLAEFQAKAEQ